jgi:hypothetical protein
MYKIHTSVRPLARAALAYASKFPVLHLRKKMRHNVREMFIAHQHVPVTHDKAIQVLVSKGWENLETMRALQDHGDDDPEFFELLSRKKTNIITKAGCVTSVHTKPY